MLSCFTENPQAVPIFALTRAQLSEWRAGREATTGAWLDATGFRGDPGSTALLPGGDGGLAGVVLGVPEDEDLWSFAGLPFGLPEGVYRFEGLDGGRAERAALGWAIGSYRFTRYRKADREPARLAPPAGCDLKAVERAAFSTWMVRDLVNTPTEDLGPAELAEAAAALAREFGAECEVITGDELLARNYPAIHAVGRGSSRAPRLIDIRWGDPAAPKVSIVGKGVCFDTGGLDLKPASGMLLMKKDMGGGAHALALARMIMDAGLPVRLRVLVPAVENMVSGNAFKPLDVLQTRKGITVEVGNTDAEGRLILCDALAEADSEKPDLLIDFATLTGAARVALGPDLPALFSNHDPTAEAFLAAARDESDPVWRLPLHQPYARHLRSSVADIGNVGEGGYAGAIIAALFLEKFVSKATPWVHLDVFAWNAGDRPGRPKGGEAMALRAAFAVIGRQFGR